MRISSGWCWKDSHWSEARCGSGGGTDAVAGRGLAGPGAGLGRGGAFGEGG